MSVNNIIIATTQKSSGHMDIEEQTNNQGTLNRSQNRTKIIIIFYQLVIAVIGIILNIIFGINKFQVELPNEEILRDIVIGAILLVINHSWIMNSTELTRNQYNLHATPEEFEKNGKDANNASKEGLNEVQRRHNIHRNTTENTIYYILLVIIFALTSPPRVAYHIWTLLFPISRLGYTTAYMYKKTDIRGIFMSLSLLSLYGMAAYLGISLFI
eukprot:545614_1